MNLNKFMKEVMTAYSLPSSWVRKLEGESVVYEYTHSTAHGSDNDVDMLVFRVYFNIYAKSNIAKYTEELLNLLYASGFYEIEDRLTRYEEIGYYNSNVSALIAFERNQEA